jgi:hypothetical protein
VPTAAALEALAQPSFPDQEAMQFVHDMWCHPGNDKMEQIYKAKMRGRNWMLMGRMRSATMRLVTMHRFGSYVTGQVPPHAPSRGK